MVGGVWALVELLVCVLFASCSHLGPSFDLLEITMRVPLASPGLRSHGLLKSYRVPFPEWAKQSPRAKQLGGQVSETHGVHDLTDLKEAPSAIALAHNFLHLHLSFLLRLRINSESWPSGGLTIIRLPLGDRSTLEHACPCPHHTPGRSCCPTVLSVVS